MNPFGYSEAVWRLFTEAPRAGALAGAVTGRAQTPASRGVVALHLKMDGAQVVDARFQAYGCPTTIAVGAWLAQQAVGRSVESLAALDAPAIRRALEISEERAHCALLGEDAAKAALAEARRVHGSPAH